MLELRRLLLSNIRGALKKVLLSPVRSHLNSEICNQINIYLASKGFKTNLAAFPSKTTLCSNELLLLLGKAILQNNFVDCRRVSDIRLVRNKDTSTRPLTLKNHSKKIGSTFFPPTVFFSISKILFLSMLWASIERKHLLMILCPAFYPPMTYRWPNPP